MSISRPIDELRTKDKLIILFNSLPEMSSKSEFVEFSLSPTPIKALYQDSTIPYTLMQFNDDEIAFISELQKCIHGKTTNFDIIDSIDKLAIAHETDPLTVLTLAVLGDFVPIEHSPDLDNIILDRVNTFSLDDYQELRKFVEQFGFVPLEQQISKIRNGASGHSEEDVTNRIAYGLH